MRWYNYDKELPHAFYEIWSDMAGISLNDENTKPDWISIPVKFSEFHVRRAKKSVVIMIGESWAYGETLPGIATAIEQYSLETQLKHGFGAKLALALGCDYYQYAVPGNCNMYMFAELDRILQYISTCGYEKVYVCMQMTEPGREMAVARMPKTEGHPIRNLYDYDLKIDMRDWLRTYDEMFFDIYQRTLEKYSNLNIDAILWKNFCKTNTAKRDYKFKIIETSWIQYSAKMLNVNLDMPEFYAVGWFAGLQEEYKKITVNPRWGTEQMNIIAASNDFIKTNPLHNNHPNASGHLLWSQYLLRQAGWKHDI